LRHMTPRGTGVAGVLPGGAWLAGVVHLPRLPLSTHDPGYGVEDLVELAVGEARAFEEAGFDAVIVENYGDSPFEARVTDPLKIAVMAVVVREVNASTSLEVGVNLLRNSGLEAYSVAVAAGAGFVRVNGLVEVLASDSGLLEPEAPRLAPARLAHPGVRVLADVACKHAASLSLAALTLQAGLDPRGALALLAREAVERGGADAVIVTGLRTGEPPDPRDLEAVRGAVEAPVLVGSGLTPENAGALLARADGAIVGSYVRRGGRAGAPLDPRKLRALAAAVREASRRRTL